ncbi:shikimate kinase [bacterium]|nr:MAG: shikimate kinase [bacterium]
MNNIYLVGFMGTGKTVTGRVLAKKLSRRYLDLDELIEEKERMSIPEIFSKNGEAYFRRLENETLKIISSGQDLIVSCGGGIVVNKDNIDIMKKTGTIFCLTASADVILKRTSAFSNRPLLNVANPKEKIESMLKERSPFYALADHTIDTSNHLYAEDTANKIMEFLV